MLERSRLVFVVVMLGCGVDPIEPTLCGNGVVEELEDCDSRARAEHADQAVSCVPPGEVHECRYTCDRTAAVSGCPAGWGCGTDNLCRHASGRYALSTTTTVIGEVEPADVDGDGRTDLVVTSFDEMHPLFNNGDGTFTTGRIVPLVFPTPAPDVGDLDGDGRADVIAGTFTGFVQLTGQDSRSLLPLAQATFPVGDGALALYPVEVSPAAIDPAQPNQHLLLVGQGATVVVRLLDQVTLAERAPQLELSPVHVFANLAGAPARADVDFNGADDVALAFAGSFEAVVVSIGTGGTGMIQRPVPLPLPADTSGVRFADVDGNGLLDLLVGLENNRVAVALGFGNGTFGTATISAFFDQIASLHPLSRALPFASIDLGKGRPGWVTRLGIFRDQGVPVLVDFNNTFVWSEAVVGDFNHDGLPDLAATVEQKTGLDVFLQTPDRLFAHTRVVTARAPSNLRTGDFDGDGTTDLAFRESAFSNVPPYALSASFGSAQGLTAIVPLGEWSDVTALEPSSVLLAAMVFRDGVDDLVVQGRIGDSAEPSVTYMFGSYQRLMLAPYEVVVEVPQPAIIAPDVAVIGRFGVALVDIDATGNLQVAIARKAPDGSLIAPAASLQANPLQLALGPFGLGFGCSKWQAIDLDGGGDDLLGLTRAGACGDRGGQLVIGTIENGAIDLVELEDGIVDPALSAVASDLDGDGVPELLVAGADRATVYFRDPDGTYTAVAVPSELGAPHAIAAINADDDPLLELAAATANGVVVFDLGPDGRSFVAPRTAIAGFAGNTLEVADIDGDAVPDLLVHDFADAGLRMFLAIPSDAVQP